MRVSLDYFTLSILGLSAAFLGSSLSAGQAHIGETVSAYPVRFALPAAPVADIVPPTSNIPADLENSTLDNDVEEVLATSQTDTSARLTTVAEMGLPDRSLPFGNLIAVEYDIASARGSSTEMTVQSAKALGGTIDVRKRVRVGEGAAGRIDVKVGSGANIYVNGAQLAAMLEAEGHSAAALAKAGSNGFVSLDELRDQGLQVRYDATGDALVIDGEA